jgi:hypothetical protein
MARKPRRAIVERRPWLYRDISALVLFLSAATAGCAVVVQSCTLRDRDLSEPSANAGYQHTPGGLDPHEGRNAQ